MTRSVRTLCFAIIAVGCGDSREMTSDEARVSLAHVGEDLLALALPAGQALLTDDTITGAAGDDWIHDDFSGTLVVTDRRLGQRTSANGEEWNVFDGEVEHSTLWVQPSPPFQEAYSRHESTGFLKVTDQDGRWFRVHRLIVGMFGG